MAIAEQLTSEDNKAIAEQVNNSTNSTRNTSRINSANNETPDLINSKQSITSSPFFDLSTLNGTNGFAINGFAAGDSSGNSVSRAGDVNKDGIDDFIINERSERLFGQSYVVFGKSTGFLPTFNLSTLDGRNGFILRNAFVPNVRSSITTKDAGDVNGDGIDDLIVSENVRSSMNSSPTGKSYVVFGRSTGLPKTLNVSTLNGRNGFVIQEASGNLSGASASRAGDVNGDGIDDLIIGVPLANSGAGIASGKVYVVNGRKAGFPSTLIVSTFPGAASDSAFALVGDKTFDRLGASVSSAGDVNGDGFDDLIIGAPSVDANGQASAGKSYIVFGGKGARRPVLSISFDFGTTINGIAEGDASGFSVSGAGDVNGDGIDDLIIGAPAADVDDTNSGQSYVVFGSKTGLPDTLNLSALNGNNGFAINGIAGRDLSGFSVSGAGDVNGDGIDDLIIGTFSTISEGTTNAGQSYVIFGNKTGFPASLTPTILDGNNGFIVNGVGDSDGLGRSVSGAGDVNGDGIDDLIIGAPNSSANGNRSGQSYVIFGQRTSTLITPQNLMADSPINFQEYFFDPIQIESVGATTSDRMHPFNQNDAALKILVGGQTNVLAGNVLTGNTFCDRL
jgi:FG-GAP repeat